MSWRTAKLLVATLGFLLLAPAAPQAQSVDPRGIPQPRKLPNRDFDKSRDSRAARDNVAAYRRLIAEQIRNDFHKLQILNNEIAQDLSANQPLDYKHIAERASKIKTLAKRLDSNLVLGKVENQIAGHAEPEISDPSLKFLLLNLHGLVVSFVENPIFHGVLDLEETKKAKTNVIEIGIVANKIKIVAKQLRINASR